MRFIVFGDTKGKDNGMNKKVLHSILKESKKLTPKAEFIVLLGDTVAGGELEETLGIQLMEFHDIIRSYHKTLPLYPVVGNHEVNITPVDDRYEKLLEVFYNDLFPYKSLDGYHNTVYTLEFPDTKLVVLNSFHPGSIHKLHKEQLDWLEDRLAYCNKNKLIFIHSPAYPTGAHLGHSLDLYPNDRDEFWRILDKYNVNIVFSGHEHNYSRRIIDNTFSSKDFEFKNSITQVILGGGGEKLKSKYKSKKGVVIAPIPKYHFIVVDTEGGYIKVTAITSKGLKIDEFEINR